MLKTEKLKKLKLEDESMKTRGKFLKHEKGLIVGGSSMFADFRYDLCKYRKDFARFAVGDHEGWITDFAIFVQKFEPSSFQVFSVSAFTHQSPFPMVNAWNPCATKASEDRTARPSKTNAGLSIAE